MRRIVVVVALAIMVAPVWSLADEPKDLARVIVPDDKEAALKTISGWLKARAIEVEERKGYLVMKRDGISVAITPFVFKKELDRLVVVHSYNPKDEFKGGKEMLALAAKLNKTQNFMTVFVSENGDLVLQANLTFYDELTARHFDSFIYLYNETTRRHILTPEAIKLLK